MQQEAGNIYRKGVMTFAQKLQKAIQRNRCNINGRVDAALRVAITWNKRRSVDFPVVITLISRATTTCMTQTTPVVNKYLGLTTKWATDTCLRDTGSPQNMNLLWQRPPKLALTTWIMKPPQLCDGYYLYVCNVHSLSHYLYCNQTQTVMTFVHASLYNIHSHRAKKISISCMPDTLW